MYRYTQKVKVIDKLPEIWFFLAAACKSQAIEIISYKFGSNDAADCNVVRKERYNSLPYTLADFGLSGNQHIKKFGDIIEPFVPLGTLCFLKSRNDKSVHVNVRFGQQNWEGEELLVYRKGVFETLFAHDHSSAVPSLDECQRRRNLAEAVLPIPKNQSLVKRSLTIPTQQQTSNSAMFEFVFAVHQGCARGGGTIHLSSFIIEATDAVACPAVPDKVELDVGQFFSTAATDPPSTSPVTTPKVTTSPVTISTVENPVPTWPTSVSESQSYAIVDIDGSMSLHVHASAMVLAAYAAVNIFFS